MASTAPPSPPLFPKFQAPPSPPSAPSLVPKYQAPPSPPDYYAPPSPPSPYRSSPSPPKTRLPKSKFTSSKSGPLMIGGAIALFFFLLWAGVTLYRRHQRRRRQCSQQGGDSPDVNAEGVQVPVAVQLAELPLTTGSRQWENQMPEEHEEMPLASGGRHRSEIEELPPAHSLSPNLPLPSAPPLPDHMSEQASPVSTHPPARNEPRCPQLAE